MDSAFILHNGFCPGAAGRVCQDRHMMGLVFLATEGLNTGLPSTNRQDIFTEPPWQVNDFFHQALLPHETSRCWLFQHTQVPATMTVMNTFFMWDAKGYHTIEMNGRTANLRFLKLRFVNPHRHHNGQACHCDVDYQTERAKDWKMYQYEFGQTNILCLCYEGIAPSSPPVRHKSNRQAFERKDEDERREKCNQPSKKMALLKSSVSAEQTVNKDEPSTALCLAFRVQTSSQYTKQPFVQNHELLRYQVTDMRKLANRMAPEESSLGDGYGQAGSNMLRVSSVLSKLKLNAKVAKKLKERQYAGGATTSGFTSSLAFTPVQGIDSETGTSSKHV